MMKRFILIGSSIGILALALCAPLLRVQAQIGGSYELMWNTVDDGGGAHAGGAYALGGTLGQSDAGASSGGIYTLAGGFWNDRTTNPPRTNTPTATHTLTSTPTSTPTLTRTLTSTPTNTPTNTPTSVNTLTVTPTATSTAPTCTDKPAKPILAAPIKGAQVKKPKVTLKWNDVACETQYKVMVKDAVTRAKAFGKTLATDTLQVKTSALVHGKTYKWSVRACNAFGCNKSAKWEFKVK